MSTHRKPFADIRWQRDILLFCRSIRDCVHLSVSAQGSRD
jgi:hypothetical protein